MTTAQPEANVTTAMNLLTLLGLAWLLIRQETTNRRLKHIMGQNDDLAAGFDQLDADTQALTAAQAKAFADLEKAVADGKTGNDLTPFIERLKTNHAAMTAALQAANDADATTQPPTPPEEGAPTA